MGRSDPLITCLMIVAVGLCVHECVLHVKEGGAVRISLPEQVVMAGMGRPMIRGTRLGLGDVARYCCLPVLFYFYFGFGGR